MEKSVELNDAVLMGNLFGPERHQWLVQVALTQLQRAGQFIIAKYVQALMAAAAETLILSIRLRYEDGAWYVHQMLSSYPLPALERRPSVLALNQNSRCEEHNFPVY